MMNEYADLELGPHRFEAGAYAVEMRFSVPGSDADIRLGQGMPVHVNLDVGELHELALAPEEYSAAITRALFEPAGLQVAFAEALASAVFSPGGTLIATAGQDGVAKIWGASTGDLQTSIYASAKSLHDAAFSPDGRLLVTGSQDDAARFYLVDMEAVIALAKTRITRSLTAQECKTYLYADQCPTNIVKPVENP